MEVASQRPEAVNLAMNMWLGVVVFETLHQILNVVMGLLGTAELKEAVKQTMNPQQLESLSDQQLTLLSGIAVVFSGLIALAIVVAIAWTAYIFRNGTKRADGARRFLTVFAVYFALRGLFVFEIATTASLPLPLVLADGIVQLLTAVCAVLAALFGAKKESVEWARAMPAEKP